MNSAEQSRDRDGVPETLKGPGAPTEHPWPFGRPNLRAVQAVRYAQRLTDADLGRIVDERWDPPVTLGVRLISVISDGLQHAGQAAYVRGLAERR